jgi:uncharacterized pyridoxamine 5'-phosphate oxidase family protein
MATVDRGMPRVRAMQTALVEDEGLTFCTGVQKDVCRQLAASGHVELAYWDPKGGTLVRVRGQVEPVLDAAVSKRIVDEVFTFLKPVVAQNGYEALGVFRLSRGTSLVWRAAQGMLPLETADF